jgi:hypothetical protein
MDARARRFKCGPAPEPPGQAQLLDAENVHRIVAPGTGPENNLPSTYDAKERPMVRLITSGAVLMLGLAVSAGAGAQTIVSAENPEQLVSIIQGLGFQAKLEKDNVGDPVIRSSSSGVEFSIYFYDCKSNKRCKSLHFTAGYDLDEGTSLEAMQKWNADKRFASAYIDDENDPFLQMDINTEGGITEENFGKTFDLWQSLKGEFEDYIGFNDKPERVSSAGSRARGA